MDLLQIRENEVFETLKLLKKLRFVIIGGYAVNAYTLPRFSIDCDIVIAGEAELAEIEKVLLGFGYKKKESKTNHEVSAFARYEKLLLDGFKVSFDVLVGKIIDRQTGVSISADWVLKNSEVRALRGKTIREELKVRIIDIDALFVIKMISCRSTDIRDLFMLVTSIKDVAWVKREIASRYDFDDRFRKVKAKITSKEFKDGLQGVYGLIDKQIFDKSVNAILALSA